MNILVVDDHEDVRNMLCDILRKKGHTPACAENGQRALASLAKSTFDLIISDIVMPEMEGIDFIIQIKQRNIPVISISGLSRETVVSEFLASLGVIGFLQKPFSYTDLMQLVDNVVVQHTC